MFTGSDAEQSCTAGRASFITGQHGLRTGVPNDVQEGVRAVNPFKRSGFRQESGWTVISMKNDRQMLEYTQGGGNGRLMMLVHHDDAEREFAYGAKSKFGMFSDDLLSEATKHGWSVISMKNDWKRVFAFEQE